MTKVYAADFETNNHEDDCHVWEWGIAKVGESDVSFGEDIGDFMFYIEKNSPCVSYFDNLKFDGGFILDWLFRQGYTFTEDRNPQVGEFSCTISGLGEMFNIRVGFKGKGNRVKIAEFRDSYKIIPMSIADMADAFGLDIHKIEEPDEWYNMRRPVGYKPTAEDHAYLANDVIILSLCLAQMLDRGFDKMTIGANALEFYKKNSESFSLFYGANGVDEYLRKAYNGGWCYVNPAIKEEEQGEGLVLDINSMYPYVMHDRLLPYGNPIYFKGRYNILHSEAHPLYIQHLRCSFELKEGYFPTLQVKNSLKFHKAEYLESSEYEVIDLYMTNVDLALFFEHYDVRDVEYIDGYMFKGRMGMFNDYIEYWYDSKAQAGREGNKGLRQISKLFLNNLYGKFSINPKFRNKIPYYEDGVVKYRFTDYKERQPLYIPVGIFITSYARSYIIRAAQALHDRFLYADTDSLHIKGREIPTDIEIDASALGAFKIEAIMKRGKYIHSKCYCEELSEDGGKTWYTKVTVAGLPHKFHAQHTFDEFMVGTQYEGVLKPVTVRGGVILVPKEKPFTIGA